MWLLAEVALQWSWRWYKLQNLDHVMNYEGQKQCYSEL